MVFLVVTHRVDGVKAIEKYGEKLLVAVSIIARSSFPCICFILTQSSVGVLLKF